MESTIYKNLDNSVDKEACGFFRPRQKLALLSDSYFYSQASIDRQTQVIYFPGSFGTFHEGHVGVVRAAQKKYPDAVVVISPANSDYAAEKYGAWSEFASNKHRYDAIKKALPDAVIDIDPMLNHRCDQNFTDLLEQYLLGHGLNLTDMEKPPIILTGKDRKSWLALNDHQDLIRVEYVDDSTGASTSALPNAQRSKKKLFLRCTTEKEFKLFCSFFEDQYTVIEPIYLDDEIRRAKSAIKNLEITHTICKEYAGLVPCLPLSRTFINPLEDGSHPEQDCRFKPGMMILDSDIYSGSTARFIRSQGCDFYALYNFSSALDKVELLDISDFYKPDFCYPWVDISSRCSMQAFDLGFHRHYTAFRSELNRRGR